MADTKPNINIPTNTWVNIYTEASIVVGTKLQIQNIGSSDLYLYSGASAPGSVPGTAFTILRPYQTATNDSGDTGAFVAAKGTGKINVKEFV